MQEIEAKFLVLDLPKIRRRLEELEARQIQERVLETNLRFDLPDGSLRSEGRVLRLRQDSTAHLTFKGASDSSQGVLSRTEIECTVDDFESAKSLLEALGYQTVFTYEKFRTTFELDEVYVMLDELPYGNFVEIEGDGIKAIDTIANKLNLELNASIMASYSALFERVRRALSLHFTELTFANFAGSPVTPEHLQVKPADETHALETKKRD